LCRQYCKWVQFKRATVCRRCRKGKIPPLRLRTKCVKNVTETLSKAYKNNISMNFHYRHENVFFCTNSGKAIASRES
jgi:predicted site-specific integrase-resolvase